MNEYARIDLDELLESDPEAYAKHRAYHREHDRKYRDKRRKFQYRPKVAMRIPDYAVKGQDVIDSRSSFLMNSHGKTERMQFEDFRRMKSIEIAVKEGRIQE